MFLQQKLTIQEIENGTIIDIFFRKYCLNSFNFTQYERTAFTFPQDFENQTSIKYEYFINPILNSKLKTLEGTND